MIDWGTVGTGVAVVLIVVAKVVLGRSTRAAGVRAGSRFRAARGLPPRTLSPDAEAQAVRALLIVGAAAVVPLVAAGLYITFATENPKGWVLVALGSVVAAALVIDRVRTKRAHIG